MACVLITTTKLNVETITEELNYDTKNRKKVTRTVARDEHGRFVAQETIDYYDDDEEPDFEVD